MIASPSGQRGGGGLVRAWGPLHATARTNVTPVGFPLLFLPPGRHKSPQEKHGGGKGPHHSFRYTEANAPPLPSPPALLAPSPPTCLSSHLLALWQIGITDQIVSDFKFNTSLEKRGGGGGIKTQPVKVPNQIAGERGIVDKRKQWKSR